MEGDATSELPMLGGCPSPVRPYSDQALRSLPTVKWWARFQRWMRANATPLEVHRQVTFLAFPSALRRVRSGIPYYANNWDLGPVLKSPEA